MADQSFAAALRLLSRRDYFRAALSGRLREKGFDDDEIVAAIRRCEELGYLDDERLARRFVELRAVRRGWGSQRLKLELLKRGAPADVAARASKLAPEEETRALDAALERIERRAPEGWWRLHERRARMVSSLVNRGFDVDAAVRAVARLADEREQAYARDEECRDPHDIS